MTQITENQLALLHSYLVVPLAIGDILYLDKDVDDVAHYALHESLSEIDPDSALLAIALSAKHIALRFGVNHGVAAALSIEADKIIDDYASEWLASYHGGPVDEDRLHDILCHVPEDLESLAELMDTLQASFGKEHTVFQKLCEILSTQARAHMSVAEFILSEIEETTSVETTFSIQDSAFVDTENLQLPQNDNIVLFPMHLVRS